MVQATPRKVVALPKLTVAESPSPEKAMKMLPVPVKAIVALLASNTTVTIAAPPTYQSLSQKAKATEQLSNVNQ